MPNPSHKDSSAVKEMRSASRRHSALNWSTPRSCSRRMSCMMPMIRGGMAAERERCSVAL